ncbi:TonB-dependent receptor [Acinetobacter sp. AOR15_HL]|uniref:TonB-dependent receptor n=1 Tax=unclassified Acinetobacter TaxID=196816 RepID=UPI0022EB5F1C|nr:MULTISPECIES: TonB-dependent receptor [unclassified Acinetobacter]MDA3557936.1 TonB-dependent receptor [Acinetobacter sp. AOR15_HL]MDA3570721.1 TonB-dependent receptor [Acinetobacter sp. AOR14_HL]
MKKKYNVRSQVTPKIGKTILKLSTLSLSMMCLTLAQAAETEPSSPSEDKPVKVIKVAVTGSSIKGVAAQSASPITVVKVDEILKQGVTTTEEALAKISANQSNFVTASNVGTSKTAGSAANLRALGANKTLVLLNGRRLAANAYDSGVTNLNIIPLAMLDRIEVLRDGASSIYGTDAIGGVINFITKKQFTGLNLTAGYQKPEQKGGEQQDYSIFGGFGDLDENGYNVFGVVDYRKGDDVLAKDRKVSQRGGILPELGVNRTSSGSFPANVPGLGNPYAATGCGNDPLVASTDGETCRYNSQAVIGIVPKTEDISVMGRATFKLNDNFNAIAEYLYARSEVTTSVAPDVFFDLTLDPSSKYYPGNGITPALAGATGTIPLYLRSQSGNRISNSINQSHRLFAGIEGETHGWDINSGVTYAHSSASDAIVSGYLNFDKTQEALNNGILNPFGPQNPEDANVWNELGVEGKYLKANLDTTTVDFTASRPIFKLPAGDVGFAVGASYRYEDWTSKVVTDVARVAPSTGVDPDEPVNTGDRNIKSVFTEFHIPLLKTLEAQIAARYDDYNDFGDTFNPKFALRWEPIKQLMFRTTYSTGFRAPTLWEVNGANSVTNTGASYNDPVLCPGGVIQPGGQKERDCNMQFDRQNGGNKTLDPEESKSFTAGLVFEPIKNLAFTLDYFNIEVDKQIATLSETAIFNDPVKYADKFVRNPDGSLDYIITTQQNLGGIKTSGFDVGLSWVSPMTATGRFGFNIDGTYITDYKYQAEPNGEWIGVAGSYSGLDYQSIILRWKHTANLNWNYENWALNLQQNFSRGYQDQNSNDQNHRVSDYTTYNISGTYKGFKNLEVTAGIKNIFDEDPPASNVIDNFQMGYDPRYADPLGRTYFVRGTYKF